jgi:release factor glutamine methyltransferase
MTVEQALKGAVERLQSEPIGPPRMAAETLLMHVLGRDRAFLHAHPEYELTEREATEFESAVVKRASGVPLQYITGHQEFWGLDFIVTPAVLIPRPETEHLVESALELIRKSGIAKPRAVDAGTGSGCIALSVAHEAKNAEMHAVDISPDALAVAKQNAERLRLAQHVQFHRGDLLSEFLGAPRSFDFVLSNPPYVGLSEADKVQREVREHEPHVAVFGGERGLDIYERLIPQAHQVLKPGGYLLMEIGYSIENEVRGLLEDWHDVHSVPDLQGIPRVVIAQKHWALSIERAAEMPVVPSLGGLELQSKKRPVARFLSSPCSMLISLPPFS